LFKKKKQTCFLGFLKRNTILLFFKGKQKKKHFELFLLHHPISSFSELHKNNFLYITMAFKIEGKEMYPFFVFAMCCWSLYSKGLASMHTVNREKTFPHKLQFHVKFMCMPC